jgi:hypothetical protein
LAGRLDRHARRFIGVEIERQIDAHMAWGGAVVLLSQRAIHCHNSAHRDAS